MCNLKKLEYFMCTQVRLKAIIFLLFWVIFLFAVYHNFEDIQPVPSVLDNVKDTAMWQRVVKNPVLSIFDQGIHTTLSQVKTTHQPSLAFDKDSDNTLPKSITWPRILNVSTREKATLVQESRDDFWSIVPPNGKMVEIGVFDGDFSDKNLKNFEKKFSDRSEYPTYYAVDMHETPKLKGRIKEWLTSRPNFHFKTGRSDVVADDFQDGSLDVVYIDACHSFDCVDKDIKKWRVKLKPGGLLSGHDFCVNREQRKFKKYKLTAPWCGMYKSNRIMVNGKDTESPEMIKLGSMRTGKEVVSQRGSVDAVLKNVGIGKYSVTFEGRKSLDDDAFENRGNPSWYSFVQ